MSGKSTLAGAANGLNPVTCGWLAVDGRPCAAAVATVLRQAPASVSSHCSSAQDRGDASRQRDVGRFRIDSHGVAGSIAARNVTAMGDA